MGGGWCEGGVSEGAGGKPEAGYNYLSAGLFGAAMSPRSASHRPRQDWRALRVAMNECNVCK